MVDPSQQTQPRLFEEAERIILVDSAGNPTSFIVLAVLAVDGRDYALMAREVDIPGDPGGDVPVFVFAYTIDEDGSPRLDIVTDETVYAELFHQFADLSDDDIQ